MKLIFIADLKSLFDSNGWPDLTRKVGRPDEDLENLVQTAASAVAQMVEIDCSVLDPLRIRELDPRDRDREVELRDCWHEEVVDIAGKNTKVLLSRLIPIEFQGKKVIGK